VLFGTRPRIEGPAIVQALPEVDQSAPIGRPVHRLVVVGDDDDGPLRLSFQSRGALLSAGGGRLVTSEDVSRDLAEFIDFIARGPSIQDPRPGLDLPYSDMVAVLAVMAEQGALRVPLRVERDRLFTEIVEAARTTRTPDREEFSADGPEVEDATGATRLTRAVAAKGRPADSPKSLLVPIERPNR
jgi:hypothetical protein